MSGSKFHGMLAAAVTPVDPDGRFQEAPFEALLERIYRAGMHGVYVCGSTGEGMLQSVDQRKAVTAAAIALSPPGAQVIVHVGAARVEDAVDLATHAARAGAGAVSSLPPVGGYTFEDVRSYYAAIATAVDIPLFVYYFPDAHPVPLSRAQLQELCELPNVAGVKLTDFDLFRLWDLRERGLTVFNGRDEVLAAGLLMGADGGVGTFYNLLPRLAARLYTLAMGGAWEEARAEQDRLNRLIRVTQGFPLFPAVKQMLTWSGIHCGPCLPPRGALTADQSARLREELRRAELETTVLEGDPA